MGLGEVGCGGMDWIDVAFHEDQLVPVVNTVMNNGGLRGH
jgi:hypothetical protein